MVAFVKPRNNRQERIAPLASLPVFFDLKGKSVLVAGGSDGSAWKAELLAAAGAEVHVFCPMDELSETFQEKLDQFVYHDTFWQAAYFKSFALAIGDCKTDEEARCFHDHAVAAGVPVNVIDKPTFCQFKFGSIVNRSPVVVGISTDGAAPILGQAIRRRIETLLPHSLKSWSQLAQAIRTHVTDALTSVQRRNFWERFVDRAFMGREPDADSVPDLIADADRIRSNVGAAGHVTLVGAGPGDAELLTLKAVRALQAADVILFDDLVSGEVLELARREAKRMLVGKRGGRESCRQEDINATMLAFAKAGKRVVRLKSGDPMIFGRAGEEIAHLDRENIPVDVIPGITAASAMASCLGISLTHRDHAQSVRFITGHSRHGGLPADVDWASVADPHTTTVFYMGGRTASLIADRLIAGGLQPSTPAVIMSDVSRATQREWRGSLIKLAEGMKEVGYENPVLIAVGSAVSARQSTTADADGLAENPIKAAGAISSKNSRLLSDHCSVTAFG
ncbi:uroporphyrinogen-III C-methyltransferase [Agrobacterium rhizogenes]|nr:uroporphyrinogen-III C-methyltransferase [Rhizobium rhizogenes]NTJ78129.1 uroporphyrinogen-III C-methyltransferase [Rhizobium rhizogenes]